VAEIEPHLPGKRERSWGDGEDNRLFVEAVLWIVRTAKLPISVLSG
jgi:hypothetical protein